MKNSSVGIEHLRQPHPIATSEGMYGYFELGCLRIISSGEGEHGGDWEHVSVSTADRCPTWDEMQQVKELFWKDTETVIQIHPPKEHYINYHPFCLHLWKKTGCHIELPPKELIA